MKLNVPMWVSFKLGNSGALLPKVLTIYNFEDQFKESYFFTRYDKVIERKSKCLDAIRSFDLPNNPLDDMIDQVSK